MAEREDRVMALTAPWTLPRCHLEAGEQKDQCRRHAPWPSRRHQVAQREEWWEECSPLGELSSGLNVLLHVDMGTLTVTFRLGDNPRPKKVKSLPEVAITE